MPEVAASNQPVSEVAMSELDEAATLTWIEMDEMQPIDSQHSKLNFARSRDFESVRVAVLFVKESMTTINRSTAIIHTDEGHISLAEMEALYKQIKKK
jgi:hypothetical protein